LSIDGPPPPLRLSLKGPKRAQLVLHSKNAFEVVGPDRPDQLVLQILDTDVKAEVGHVVDSRRSADSSLAQSMPDEFRSVGVAQTGEVSPLPERAESAQVPDDGLGASDGEHGRTLGLQITSPPSGQRLHRNLSLTPSTMMIASAISALASAWRVARTGAPGP